MFIWQTASLAITTTHPKDGSIGPAIAGSSKELLEARVLSTSYPPNYKPKRPTKVMPQFPFLKEEIPYLAAYLTK